MRHLLCAAALLSAAGDWPQFRGPDGSGVADGQKPPAHFGPDRNLRWKVPVPPGASSPVVVGDRLYLTAFDGGKLYTLAYDPATGRELWRADARAEVIEEYHHSEGSPAASTPVADGSRVVSYFGSCGLVAHDPDGKPIWKVPMPVAKTNNGFGTGTSPVLADGLVLLVRDLSEGSKALAVNAADGKVVWERPRDGFPTSYATPVVWRQPGGRAELVVPGFLRLTAYDARTGSDRWVVGKLPSVACTTPVVGDGVLLYAGWSPGNEDGPLPSFDDLSKGADTNGDGALDRAETAKTFLKDFFDANDTDRDGKITRAEWDGMVAFLKRGQNYALAVRPGGTGDVTDSHVAWRYTKGLPYVPSPLYYRGRLYFVRDGGLLTVLDAKTGKAVAAQERVGAGGGYYASPVASDGRVYLASLDGTLTVVPAEGGLKPLHQVKLGENLKATPAIAGDTLYVRTAKHLYAFAGAD